MPQHIHLPVTVKEVVQFTLTMLRALELKMLLWTVPMTVTHLTAPTLRMLVFFVRVSKGYLIHFQLAQVFVDTIIRSHLATQSACDLKIASLGKWFSLFNTILGAGRNLSSSQQLSGPCSLCYIFPFRKPLTVKVGRCLTVCLVLCRLEVERVIGPLMFKYSINC